MKLGGDLTSTRWLVGKGLLFFVIVGVSGGLLVFEEDRLVRLALVCLCVWSSARSYYFLFYVLERYVGVEGRYAGLLDLIARLRRR
ncbi:MAG: hypothetical protein Q8S33_06575 [Myxococcales bacterium]|nr:hypothetical protein [Myxococcales bacterium]MDP3499976.1 hypothetical protein [Myxococcales bacterium]